MSVPQPSPPGSSRPPAGKAATINDIARLAGVSKKTVSRIINNSPLVRKDTREKVEALMREVGYAPDPLARGLAFRRSFLIGMVYDNPTAQYVVDMQNGALDALRGSSFELVVHPCDTRSPGYIEGVKRFVQQQKLHGVILVPRASEDQALALFRIAQEAFTNIRKYARASHVELGLSLEEGELQLWIRDDGAGFDPESPMLNRHGLAGMKHRVQMFGGSLEVTSRPGQGCCIEARMPLSPRAA